MTLQERLDKASDNGFSDFIEEEYCLTHDLQNQTVECRVYVRIKEPNGQVWTGERIVKMRLKK
jgi:hypothetical protein